MNGGEGGGIKGKFSLTFGTLMSFVRGQDYELRQGFEQSYSRRPI